MYGGAGNMILAAALVSWSFSECMCLFDCIVEADKEIDNDC